MSQDSPTALRLFLSADIEGSTDYKARNQAPEDRSPEWLEVFEKFFGEFPGHVKTGYEKCEHRLPVPPEQLESWKFAGDEIALFVKLTRHEEVLTHLSAFRKALDAYQVQWKEDGIDLRLKGCGWLAGFPIKNSEIHINGTTDFIGPYMDIGFRLSKEAIPDRLVLSADLALMFLDARNTCGFQPKATENFKLRFWELRLLKGVLAGEPYPIFYWDLAHPKSQWEDLVRQEVGDQQFHQTAADLLEQFLSDSKVLRVPFIYAATETNPRYQPKSEDKEKIAGLTGGIEDQGKQPSRSPDELIEKVHRELDAE